MPDTKTTPRTDAAKFEALCVMHDARPWPGNLGPAKPSGDASADARTALAELDAIRAGAPRDYGAQAAAAVAYDNARGIKPAKTAAQIEAALEGGRRALADRETERAAEAPARSDFNAMVQAEINKLLGKRPA